MVHILNSVVDERVNSTRLNCLLQRIYSQVNGLISFHINQGVHFGEFIAFHFESSQFYHLKIVNYSMINEYFHKYFKGSSIFIQILKEQSICRTHKSSIKFKIELIVVIISINNLISIIYKGQLSFRILASIRCGTRILEYLQNCSCVFEFLSVSE